MRKRPYKILCVRCREPLYWFHGEFEGPFDSSKFKPMSLQVPKPGPKTEMVCPSCSHPWYMVTFKGNLVVMTDRGWKPREPEGIPPLLLPNRSTSEISYRDSETEFSDPKAR